MSENKTTAKASVRWDSELKVGRVENDYDGGPLQQNWGKDVKWWKNTKHDLEFEVVFMMNGGLCRDKPFKEGVKKNSVLSYAEGGLCYKREVPPVQSEKPELEYTGWIKVDGSWWPVTDSDAVVPPLTGEEQPDKNGYVKRAAPPPRVIIADPHPIVPTENE